MNLRKQALRNLSDKGKHEVYQSLKEKKKTMSPETYESYRKNIIEMMGDEEDSEELDSVEKSAVKMRKRLAERRKGSLAKD